MVLVWRSKDGGRKQPAQACKDCTERSRMRLIPKESSIPESLSKRLFLRGRNRQLLTGLTRLGLIEPGAQILQGVVLLAAAAGAKSYDENNQEQADRRSDDEDAP